MSSTTAVTSNNEVLRHIVTVGHPALSQATKPVPSPVPDHNNVEYYDDYCHSYNAAGESSSPSTETKGTGGIPLHETVDRLHEMLKAFRQTNGFGRAIAANQIGSRYSIVVACLSPSAEVEEPWEGTDKDGFITLYNPRVVWRSEEEFTMWDECFSFPSMLVRVRRHKSVSLAYDTAEGKTVVKEQLPQGLSELFQHETDHLLGLTSFDRIAPVPPEWDHGRNHHITSGVPPVVTRENFVTHRVYFDEMVNYVPK